MNQRAADAGFRSRSEYICKLVEDDLRKAGVLWPCRRELSAGVAQVRPLSDYDGTAISLGFHG